jgi:hypothetical protein
MTFLRLKELKNYFICVMLASLSCNNNADQEASAKDRNQQANTGDSVSTATKGTYAYDADYLKKYTANVVELTSSDGMEKVLLSGDYQGRVMTTTASGDEGTSFGWLNYALISAKEKKKQFNPYGGEERFWMGPEGGQYSIYFAKGDSFDMARWQVPSFIDTELYYLDTRDQSSASFIKETTVTNYSGTRFNLKIQRQINLLSREELVDKLKTPIPDNVQAVGFETVNKITNTGRSDWTRAKGLLSVWLLGMFTPTPQTKIIIPFRPVKDAASHLTSNYFGPIPPERLRMSDSILSFTCDGKFRSKIGLSPMIAKPMAASFDFQKNVLTVLIPSVNRSGIYVNSKWEIQKDPYRGDVINAYNDGPLDDGTQMGPFYEIESSSPALALKRGQTGEYRQTTCHFQGLYPEMKQLASQLLGVDLDSIR